jgi:antitoxin (DNA-binding transcriptional repressor) of toxin-antitoxin stability system
VYTRIMSKRATHISESEAAATEIAELLARVRAGEEFVIEKDKRAVAVLHSPAPLPRTISECIALLPEDSTATIDADFAKDVEVAVASHREALNPPAWD